MYSDERNRCSHRLGFPVRKSPDHRLIASSRGLSQLSTSFIASLRQGIHTHALSSLTIKSISNTKYSMSFFLRCFPSGRQTNANLWEAANTCSKYCPSNIRLSKIRLLRYNWSEDAENQHPAGWSLSISSLTSPPPLRLGLHAARNTYRAENMVGLDRLELSTSPLSGVRSSHLSYRPKLCWQLVELVGIEPATS
jgi:hypothetical protein